jgi:small subunit ribosomal protein S21
VARIRGKVGSSILRIPIIALTAQAMTGDRERLLASGLDAYVSKPVRAQELFQAIDGLLRLPTTASTSQPVQDHPEREVRPCGSSAPLRRLGDPPCRGRRSVTTLLAVVIDHSCPKCRSQTVMGSNRPRLRAQENLKMPLTYIFWWVTILARAQQNFALILLIRNGGVDRLAEVRLQDGESLENALRRFKRKVQQEDIIKEIKKHSFYLKPGEKRRVKAALARKRARKKARHEQD